MKVSTDITPMQTWYQLYRSHFIRIGLNLGYRMEEIQDFINQFFLDLLEKKIDPATINNPKAYLSTAFKRKLIDHNRKTGKIYFLDLGTVEEELCEMSVQERLEQLQTNAAFIVKLRNAYQNLPERCQHVILLKFYKGLSTEQICLETGLTKRTVYNNLFEAIKLLRSQLNHVSPKIPFTNLLPLLPLVMMHFLE